MNPRRTLTAIATRSGRLPRRTVRLRLTALFAALFLASGAALLGITYVLVAQATSGCSYSPRNGVAFCHPPGGGDSRAGPVVGAPGRQAVIRNSGLTIGQQRALQAQQQAEAGSQRAAEMDTLVSRSGIALAIMAAVSVGLGWIAAGRVLRPLRTITSTAQRISASNLNQRLSLGGPDDEIKQLGDTFDALLARLEASFHSQRQFIANASHELRTPLARQRLVSQIAISDPDASIESLRHAHERVLASGAQQEQLINALLTLARGQAGLDLQEPFDLASVTGEVVHGHRAEASHLGLDIRASVSPAPLAGDPRLAGQLVTNLVENALRHNEADGWIEVTTGTRGGHAVLFVLNSGPQIPLAQASRLLQPFQRLGTDRTGQGRGLGLSIVKAIADAHGATLTVVPRHGGGLRVEVTFPAPGPGPVRHGWAPDMPAAARGPDRMSS